MSDYDLGTAHGTIDIDYDGARAVAQADQDMEKLKRKSTDTDKSMAKFGKTLNTFAGFIGKAAKGFAIGAVAVSSLSNAFGLLVGTGAALVSTLTPLVGAVLAPLPGIILGGVAAMAVFKVATMGVGDALKQVGADQEKFNEAIKGLSPQAQGFAKAIRAAATSLKPLQQAIQNAFFRGTGPMITQVVKGLTTLRGPAVGAADAFNQIIRRVLEFAKTPTFLAGVRDALASVRSFLLNVDGAIKPLLTGFFNLARQAKAFAADAGGAVASALIKLGDVMNNVNLKDVFTDAKNAIAPLIQLAKNLGSIFQSVFGGLAVDGAGALGVLVELTGQLAAFLKTAQGQEALRALGQAMSVISGAVGQVFLELLRQLAPVIVALAPAFAQLALQAAGILVPALQTLGPVLLSIANFLAQNMSVVGPLVLALVGLAGTVKVVTAAVNAWKAVETAAQALRLRSIAAWTAQKVAMAAQVVVMNAVRVATIAWTAVQWLLNAALTANPIGLIIVAIGLLVAAVVLIATKTTWFQTIWKVVWGAIKAAAQAVANWFMGTIVPSFQRAFDQLRSLLNGIRNFFSTVWNAIRSAVQTAVNAVRTVISTVFNAIRSFIQSAVNAWRAVISAAWNAILAVVRGAINSVLAVIRGIQAVIQILRSAFDRGRAAVATALNTLISVVRGVPGRVVSALGNLGGLLVNAGRNLISGFVRGIKDKIGDAIGAVRDGISAIGRLLPGSPAKEGPLSGRGYVLYRGRNLVQDFAEGMLDNVGKLQRASTVVARVAAPVVPSITRSAGTSAITLPRPPVPAAAPAAQPLSIGNLNVTLQGIWDFRDPQATRRIAVDLHQAIEKVKGEYR